MIFRLNRIINALLRPFGVMLMSSPNRLFAGLAPRPTFTKRQIEELRRISAEMRK